ncbi:ATP-grasp domain-containing protein, partial [Chloroflexota bacterium]
MKLFEFEAKRILKEYGIAVPRGDIATSAGEAEAIARKIGQPVVLKSQILVSGRGKAGGIQFAKDVIEAKKLALNLIGLVIKDSLVDRLLVEETLDITAQFYISIAVDRQAKTYVVLSSTEGGVDIEQVAETSPEKISRHRVNPLAGFSREEALEMLSRLNVTQDDAAQLASALVTLYQIAMDNDAELVELNPLVKTVSGQFVAADARII